MSQGQIELEQAVLACMVSSPRVAPKIAAELAVEDFTDRAHRMIFDAMVDMLEKGERVDELTLSAELRGYGVSEAVIDTAAGLYGVAASLASVDHALEYAAAVREEAVRRRLVNGLDAALGARGGVEDVVSAVEAATFEARARLHSNEGMRELSGASILSPLDGFLSASESVRGFPYPFASMREEYGPYEAGRYTLLGGPSGDGKTTIAFQWVEELCEAGASVCIAELEMTQVQVGRLLMLQGGAVTQRQLKKLDPMTEIDAKRYDARKRKIGGWDLKVVCGPTTPQQLRAMQARERFDVIVVDHMHKFPRATDYVELTSYSSQLHRITRDLDCSVIALLQLNKAQRDQQGSRMRAEPSIGDLRGSGAMEEDADDAFLVYQDRDTLGRRTGTGQLKIEKMRDGVPNRRVPLQFDPKVVKFYEYDPDHASGPSVLAKRIQNQASKERVS
jgi:replicative DNA helicase